jgi:hypothetical protein
MLNISFLLLLLVATAPVLPQTVPPRSVVINEILFNPKGSSSDYVELYNRSDSLVDLSRLFLTNRTSSGSYGVLKKLSDTTRYLLPGRYVVFTEDAAGLSQQYFVQNPRAVLEVSSLPAYSNSEGTVALLDSAKNVVDEVHYREDWQYALLADADGVALERIDPEGVSMEKSNWRSAASDVGYGTPSYQNSQYGLFQNRIANIAVTPRIFSPDGDGVDDAATIKYVFTQGSAVANVFIYDATGRQVRHLVKNGTIGTAGIFVWDGLDEKGQRLPIGQYIIYSEVFTLEGKKQHFKNVIVLARRLN